MEQTSSSDRTLFIKELDKKFYKIPVVAKLLINCALKGDIAYFKSLILSKELIDGLDLLSYAATGGSQELVRLFVTKGNATVNLRDATGFTPLHCATVSKQVAIARFLVKEAGADLSALNCYNLSPFSQAIMIDSVEMVRFFIEECGMSCKNIDENKITALHMAAAAGSCNVARFLIDNNFCSVDEQDTYQNTPLHYAVYCQKYEMSQLLLARKADVHKRNNRGYKPLHPLTGKKRRVLLSIQENN
jgi:ankyrin repeat protein